MTISTKTQEIVDALAQDDSPNISACTYTWAFGRGGHVSAAFRIAKKRDIIREKFISVAGTSVYVRVGVAV